jgi:Contact-dependent growth inhibition CdiA C-terminal domain
VVADYSQAGLAAAAGVDPWSLAEQVRAGDPGGLEDGALRLRRAGVLAAEAARDGDRADSALAEAFRNDGVAVFDAAASGRRGAVLLADRGEKIEEAARAVLDVAAELSAAVAGTTSRLSLLDAELNRIIGMRNGFAVTGSDPAALAAAEWRFFRLAVEAVRGAGARVQADLDAYDAVLVNRTARLAGLGYGSPGAGGSASFDLSSAVEPVGDALGTLGAAVRDNPEAVAGLLAGLGLVLAGSTLLGGGVAVTAGTGGVALPVGGPAVAGGWSLVGIGGALLAASANEIAQDAADKLAEPSNQVAPGQTGSGGAAAGHTVPSKAADPAAEPTGRSARAGPQDNPEKVRGLLRENESAETLAKAGYEVEQQPNVPGRKKPDYRIEGEIFDNYAPSGDRARNIASNIAKKVVDDQADRIVLNLADTPVDAEQVSEQLHTWPVPGLNEVIVIDKLNRISHVFP